LAGIDSTPLLQRSMATRDMDNYIIVDEVINGAKRDFIMNVLEENKDNMLHIVF
jgi:hypothetical protein